MQHHWNILGLNHKFSTFLPFSFVMIFICFSACVFSSIVLLEAGFEVYCGGGCFEDREI